MPSVLKQTIGATLKVDWSQFEGLAALRCTVGVAVPLVAGLVLRQPLISVFGAVGAVSVGFGSFQGAYRSRATIMMTAAIGMAVSIFVGSLAGHSTLAMIVVATLWGFGSGLLVAIGPAASFVGLQSAVAVLIAGGFPTDLTTAAGRLVTVFAGGVIQTILVVVLWPLRRFPAERKALASVYRSLAAFAPTIPQRFLVAPEPHTLSTVRPTFGDPQPFARVGEVLVFRALLDEAERIRASLAALALHQGTGNRGEEAESAALGTLVRRVSDVLNEIAAALDDARAPEATSGLWETLESSAQQLTRGRRVVDSLLGQLRAAWRIAGFPTSPEDQPAPVASLVPRLRPVPPIRDAVHTLRANLTLESTAFRHAVRLAVTLAVATAVYRLAALPRGYWVPMTALLVLKPEFQETFATSVARMLGTALGAVGATALTAALTPGPLALTVLVLAFVWCCYAFFRTSYTIFTIGLTGYVVFLLAIAGLPEMTAAVYRTIDTALGGLLALVVYAIWPTWEASRVRDRIAAMFEAHGRFIERLLKTYANPAAADSGALQSARIAARLARSNAEASVERMLGEPASQRSIDPNVALGILAAIRRHALASLALQARLERGSAPSVPGLDELGVQFAHTFRSLAAAVRNGTPPRDIPPLRETHGRLRAASKSTLMEETDLIVDSLNTIAELLGAQRVAMR